MSLGLAKAGYDIALHYHSSENEAEEVAQAVQERGVACELFQADLAEHKQVMALAEKVFSGGCDLLVNNASIYEAGSLQETSEALFDRHFAINLKAPYFLTQQFAKRCKQGSVVNMLDVGIHQQRSHYMAYTLTKKAFADFTTLAAKELGPKIRVNGIAPGPILPSKGYAMPDVKARAETMPLKQLSRLEDVVDAVLVFAKRPYLTGDILHLDSGEHVV